MELMLAGKMNKVIAELVESYPDDQPEKRAAHRGTETTESSPASR